MKQKCGVFWILLGILDASLSGNMLAGKSEGKSKE